MTLNLAKYHNQTAAAALLFESKHGNKGLRIEAPGICKEFTDRSYIGSDPQGVLYYYSADDFEHQDERDKGPVVSCYTVHKLVDTKGDAAVHIMFWNDGQSEEKPFAEFVAKDPQGLVSAYNMDGYASKGAWVNLDMAMCTAFVRKTSTEDKITLTVDALNGMTAVWYDGKTVGGGQGKTLDGKSIAVSGNLSFKKLRDLKKGIFAKYNNDHIVFYSNDWISTDFTAYFILEPTHKTTITSKLHNQTVAAPTMRGLGLGLLYYNSRDDFEPQDERQGGKISANYKVHKVMDNGEKYVNIKFWRDGDTEAQAFAEFIGKDPAALVDSYGMDGYSSAGDWVNLDISICTAFVRKISTENKILQCNRRKGDILRKMEAAWNHNAGGW
ncbi:hypothetical protein FB45DRAFT_1105695 [Roridomyces roridus]|uniref:Uncharacterized protein n=1 Tax=Roridomyces roridus TaxID=1738132 RepID=A0AAD7BBN3_9AGAR|nr:hypothetical protein FB45DRAFT_1105695 [Roridomyces roridus]